MCSSTVSSTSSPLGVGGQRHAWAVLTPEKGRGTHCIGGGVGLGTGLEGCGKSRLQPGSNHGPSSRYRGAIPTTLSRPYTHGRTRCIYGEHMKAELFN